jgi:hypothetical protein
VAAWKGTRMQADTSWHPSEDEVRHIRDELRPLLIQLARRDTSALTEERWRRLGAVPEL